MGVLVVLRAPSLAKLPRAPIAAAAGAVVLVFVLAFGPFKVRRQAWNGATFTERLAGQVIRDSGPTRGIVSMAGRGLGPERVLVRADLLIEPRRLVSTSFQMEYLASGATCRGIVTKVESYGFSARCRMPDGTSRSVHAQWQPANGSSLQGGEIRSSA